MRAHVKKREHTEKQFVVVNLDNYRKAAGDETGRSDRLCATAAGGGRTAVTSFCDTITLVTYVLQADHAGAR